MRALIVTMGGACAIVWAAGIYTIFAEPAQAVLALRALGIGI